MNEPLMFRDIQVATEVNWMYQLGKYNKEFTIYGTSCLVENEAQYVVSKHYNAIHRYMVAQQLAGNCPTPVLELRESLQVPSGLEEEITKALQYELAKQLREQYPKRVLELLVPFQKQPANNAAAPLLYAWRDALNGLFSEQENQLFEGAVQSAFLSKVLEEQDYQRLQQWLVMVRRDMEDNVIIKDSKSRNFFSLVYRENGKCTYYTDAVEKKVLEKKLQLEKEHFTVSPVYAQTIWYGFGKKAMDVQKEYDMQLQQVLSETYLNRIEQIKRYESGVCRTAFQSFYQACQKSESQLVLAWIAYYGRLWNC